MPLLWCCPDTVNSAKRYTPIVLLFHCLDGCEDTIHAITSRVFHCAITIGICCRHISGVGLYDRSLFAKEQLLRDRRIPYFGQH